MSVSSSPSAPLRFLLLLAAVGREAYKSGNNAVNISIAGPRTTCIASSSQAASYHPHPPAPASAPALQSKKSSLKPKRNIGIAEKTTGKLSKAVKAISHSARKVVQFSNNVHTYQQPAVEGRRKEASHVGELQLRRQLKKPKPRGEGGESDLHSKLNLNLSQKRSLGSYKWPRDIQQHGAIVDVQPVGKSKTATTTKTRATRTTKRVSQLKKIGSGGGSTTTKDSIVTGGKTTTTTTKKVKKLRIKTGTIGRKPVSSTGYTHRLQPRLAYSIGPSSVMLIGRQGTEPLRSN